MSNLTEKVSRNPQDPEFKNYLLEMGMLEPRQLEDGEWVAIMPLMFTMSVCSGVTETQGYKYRWCFADAEEAYQFLAEMKSFDDIPTKRESLKGHRYLHKPLLEEKDALGFHKW